MRIRDLSITGAFETTPVVHRDERGAFAEWFRADRFEEATGHRFDLAQANCSVSAVGTLRGIHFAQLPPGQAKYVTCLHGAVLDVVVDLRVGSPTYSRWEAVPLDATTRNAVFLDVGLGHAFLALEDHSVVSYLCSTPYDPGREHAVDPFDPDLGIDWPDHPRTLLSTRDAQAPSLAQTLAGGLLPEWEA